MEVIWSPLGIILATLGGQCGPFGVIWATLGGQGGHFGVVWWFNMVTKARKGDNLLSLLSFSSLLLLFIAVKRGLAEPA